MKMVSVFAAVVAVVWSIAPVFGQSNNGALSISPREQQVTLTTQSEMPHLLALWNIRGMFLYDFVEVQSVTITQFGPGCVPYNELQVRTSTRGIEDFEVVVLGDMTKIVFAEPLRVERVQEVELGIYSTSNDECSFSFALELTEAQATTPKGSLAEINISQGLGGTVTPSN